MTIREAKKIDVGDTIEAVKGDQTDGQEYIFGDKCVVIETYKDEHGLRSGDGVVFNDTTGKEHYADFTDFKTISLEQYKGK